MENLQGYNLVCEFALCTFNLIESWVSPGCSYEFDAAYVQQEKSHYLL